MPAALATLVPLLLTVFVLMAGNGLLSTLVPLRGNMEQFSAVSLGLIGSVYFIGMLAGTWSTPAIVRQAGHIRALLAYVAVSGACVLAFAIVVDPLAWMAFRLVIGFCFAGIFAIIESWINDKATNENRGRLLAANNVVHFSGSATGQQILRLDDPKSFTLFSGVGILFMLSLVPIALTRAEPPPLPAKGRLDLVGLYRTSPIGVIGMVLVGLSNATFWMLVPAYIDRLGFGAAVVSSFMTAVILGSALGPYPIGRLSDRFDRRKVIVGVAFFAAIVNLTMVLTRPDGAMLYVLGFGLGLCLPMLYVLISAHTNDRSGRDKMVAISSTLLFLYCVGGIVGPLAAAFLMSRLGDASLFAWNGTVQVALGLFVLWRIFARAAPAEKVVAAPEKPLGS